MSKGADKVAAGNLKGGRGGRSGCSESVLVTDGSGWSGTKCHPVRGCSLPSDCLGGLGLYNLVMVLIGLNGASLLMSPPQHFSLAPFDTRGPSLALNALSCSGLCSFVDQGRL